MSVYITVFAASVPLGSLFAGGLARAFGAPVALAAGGILTGLAVLYAALRLRPSLAD
jgi:predicted MFS family arabinose efflux permease